MEFFNFLDEMVANGAILLEFSFNYVFHFLGVCEIIKILIGNYAFLIRDVILGLLDCIQSIGHVKSHCLDFSDAI